MSSGSSDMRVFVRVRPTSKFAQDVITIGEDNKSIEIHLKKDEKMGVVNNKHYDWSYRMDGILNNVCQEVMYNTAAKPVVSRALQGYNGTVMCYGQTGAGKTHTITGATESYKHRGIIPRALQQVFKEIEEQSESSVTVRVSYLEIYNETLYDLLSTLPEVPAPETHMSVVEDLHGVYVKGLSIHHVPSEEHALNLLFEGVTNRTIGSHVMNKNSSRSHCIFTIHLESHSRVLSNAKYTMSKINLVDLAGSERLGKTMSEGQLLREATYINKSLTFLEQVIIALADRRDHIPFRQSKLTHALKDSIGGKCYTVLVANVYGEDDQIDETLSTLRFASRMKCIPAESVVMEHYDPVRMCKNLQQEVEHLRRELTLQDALGHRLSTNYEAFNDSQIAEMNAQVHRYLAGKTDEIEILNVRQIQEIFAQFKLIVQQREQDVETRLRQKYTLIDKNDYEALSTAQKAGLADADGQLVGEVDGNGFGIGVAPLSAKPSSSIAAKKHKTRKSREPASPTGKKEGPPPSPAIGKDLESPSKTMLSTSLRDLDVKETLVKEQQDIAVLETQPSEVPIKEEASRPSTPPPKSEAFDNFKADRGIELNRLYKENKSILGSRKGKLKEITQRINMIKKEIDDTSKTLNVTKLEREKQGEYISDEGQVIIDEEEFKLIVRLKDLKKQYRGDFDDLQDVKAEVQYCQKLVDQCRHRLLTEFEVWYNESFVLPEDVQNLMKIGGTLRAGFLPVHKLLSLGEDEQEQYDRLQQQLLMDVPGSLAFTNARNRSSQKHCYSRAMAQLTPTKKKAGLISSSIKNKPPSNLSTM